MAKPKSGDKLAKIVKGDQETVEREVDQLMRAGYFAKAFRVMHAAKGMGDGAPFFYVLMAKRADAK